MCELGVGGELSRHPKYLLESLSADEWADWLAWRKIFPSPQSRADINTALIRKSSLDPHCKGKIDAVKLMPRYGGSRRKLRTGAEMAAAARAWCESVNRPDRKVSW